MSDRIGLDNYKQQIADLYTRRSPNYDAGEWHPRIAHRLVEYAQIQPRQQIIDIATGTGMVAIEAAKIVGDRGRVIGIDISTGMLDRARSKVAKGMWSGNSLFPVPGQFPHPLSKLSTDRLEQARIEFNREIDTLQTDRGVWSDSTIFYTFGRKPA